MQRRTLKLFFLGWLVLAPCVRATPVTNGLALWLNAQTIGSNQNDTVGFWPDHSGQNRHLDNHTQTPTYQTNGLNGQPVVRFDGGAGAGDYLWSSYNFDPHPTYTLFTVARYAGADRERVVSSATRNWLFGFHGAQDERWFAEGWIHMEGTGNTAWHIHTGSITNSADPLATFWKDGNVLVADSTGSGNGTHTIGQLALGGYRTDRELSEAEVAEVLIYDRILNQSELNEVGFYLERKYGLDTAWIDVDAPIIDNLSPTGLAANAAFLNGDLVSTGTSPTLVTLYWGPTDGGTNPAAWSNALPLGLQGPGPLSVPLTGLADNTLYAYRFFADNATHQVWAEPSVVFSTDLVPTNFLRRLKIQFCGYNNRETLTNFPVGIHLGTNLPGFNYADFASPLGHDLRAADTDGESALDLEIETWNTNGESILWVAVTELSQRELCIYLYWG
ncbi:MAG: hypothetical protein AAF492_02100, partial [Verrucomicrobiota bacterium]